ncbi:DUF385 domain-containing protein [Cryobacterium sp. TMS1-13-1]|nr:DUF385 domain-containing protein [Cryobacterium sp. TMS1-13-1]
MRMPVLLYRRSRGRIGGSIRGVSVLLLTVVGRKTGLPHTSANRVGLGRAANCRRHHALDQPRRQTLCNASHHTARPQLRCSSERTRPSRKHHQATRRHLGRPHRPQPRPGQHTLHTHTVLTTRFQLVRSFPVRFCPVRSAFVRPRQTP